MAKSSFVGEFSVTVGAATAGIVVGDRAPYDALRCFDLLAASSSGSAPAMVTFGFMSGDRKIYAGSFLPTIDKQVVRLRGKLWLPGEWRPFAEFSGVAQGDVLKLYTYGYVTDRVD